MWRVFRLKAQPIKGKIDKLFSSKLMFALLKTLIRGKDKLYIVTKKNSERETYGDGTVLYFHCGGGYTNLHIGKFL